MIALRQQPIDALEVGRHRSQSYPSPGDGDQTVHDGAGQHQPQHHVT
jgi:hypothetical protein